MAMISDAEYQRIVGPDERYLIDLDSSVYLLTEEPRTDHSTAGTARRAHALRPGPAVRAMFDLATAAVEGALAAGARYADARVMVVRHEAMRPATGWSRT